MVRMPTTFDGGRKCRITSIAPTASAWPTRSAVTVGSKMSPRRTSTFVKPNSRTSSRTISCCSGLIVIDTMRASGRSVASRATELPRPVPTSTIRPFPPRSASRLTAGRQVVSTVFTWARISRRAVSGTAWISESYTPMLMLNHAHRTRRP